MKRVLHAVEMGVVCILGEANDDLQPVGLLNSGSR